MRKVILIAVLFATNTLVAQKYLTREAYIKFYGSTSMENIDAATNQASSVIDADGNAIVFQALVNGFTFEKALMQEHFNENYAESETYPKVNFKGKFVDWDAKKHTTNGSYNLKVSGVMNFHGVDQKIEVPVVLLVEGGKMSLTANFKMVPEDYKIEIPSAVRNKIAKEFDVTVKANYQIKK